MIYVFLADGFEIIEAMAPVDMLRRVKLDVKTVGVTGEYVTSSNNTVIKADILPNEIEYDNIDAVILPGGMPGALNLEKSDVVQKCIDIANDNYKLICAICAAPSILGHKGLLEGKEATCFPGFEDSMKGAKLSEKYVVTDTNIITARGAGVATEFGLEIVKTICGKNVAATLRNSIQCQ